jgi:DNA-binding transcriptional ArsR family regulator
MRSSILDPLLTPTKQALLAATILQPDKRWYFRELARELHLQPSSIQRDLSALTEAGILERHYDGNRVYYQAQRECPIFPELEQVLIKTVGVVDVLREALKPVRKKIKIAFIYGSIAAGKARAESDVDLMIVGDVGLERIARLFQGIEIRLGRQVNPTVYTVADFRQRLTEESHFLRTVLGSPVLFVQGTRNDLEGFIQKPAREAASDEPRRTARSPRGGGARSQRRKADQTP